MIVNVYVNYTAVFMFNISLSAPASTTTTTATATVNVTTTPVTVITTPGTVTTPHSTVSHHVIPGNVISGDECLVTGKGLFIPLTTVCVHKHFVYHNTDSKRCMKLMRKHIIPKITGEWEAVAAFLDYSIMEKRRIKTAHK